MEDFLRPSRPVLGLTQLLMPCVTGLFSRGEMQPGRGDDHPPASRSKVKESVELYVYSAFEPSRMKFSFVSLSVN